VLKGPTDACLAWAGQSADAAGVARHYGGLLDAIVADEPVEGVRSHVVDTWMGGSTARRQLAQHTLELADTLLG
jgi:LPPG:FO 2-phospho-L-lactate transferase